MREGDGHVLVAGDAILELVEDSVHDLVLGGGLHGELDHKAWPPFGYLADGDALRPTREDCGRSACPLEVLLPVCIHVDFNSDLHPSRALKVILS